jgi:hypothetical protein
MQGKITTEVTANSTAISGAGAIPNHGLMGIFNEMMAREGFFALK